MRWKNIADIAKRFKSQLSGYNNNRTSKAASLYVHWPYCAKICPYCDFNKYVRDSVNHGLMRSSLLKEIDLFIALYDITEITTVYFGGGTPSLAEAKTIEAIVERVRTINNNNTDIEITLEVNPTSAENKKLRDFQLAGINRVSIGVQALKDADLKTLGRDHDTNTALKCIEQSMQLFNKRVSVDLMFGRPHQSLRQWESELETLLSLDAHHVSLYQLTMKKSTQMEKEYSKGKLHLPSNEETANMYELSIKMLKDERLMQYEVSNFAVKGYESGHNTSYWLGSDYIGVGPGAHGRLTQQLNGKVLYHSLVQSPVPEHWMEQVQLKGHGTRLCRTLTKTKRIDEMLMLGLRYRNGITSSRFLETTGCDHAMLLNCNIVQSLIDSKLLVLDDSGIRATSSGMFVLDALIVELSICIEETLFNV